MRRLIKTNKQIQDALRAQKDKCFVTKGAQDFVFRMGKTSGVSDATGVPDGIWEFVEGSRGAHVTNEREPLLQDAQNETEMIIFDAVGGLLKRTNTDPSEVGCLFMSLAAMSTRQVSMVFQACSFSQLVNQLRIFSILAASPCHVISNSWKSWKTWGVKYVLA